LAFNFFGTPSILAYLEESSEGFSLVKRRGVLGFDISKFQPLTILTEMTPALKAIFSIMRVIWIPRSGI
jgi:hypothetical protein